MVNEAGHFPEFCKKSVQAQAADMDGVISESFFAQTALAQLQQYSPRQLEELGRLTFPVIAEESDPHYRRISWDEALDKITRIFCKTNPNRTFFYSSGRSSNEAAFLMQLMARAYGSPHINNCSFYCHQASGVALNKVYGSGTSSVVLDDLKKTNLAIVVGANPGSNHPRLITQLINLRKRGGKVIVINPLKELGLVRFKLPSSLPSLLFGSSVSDLYLQPKIGGDIALFKGFLKHLIETGNLDQPFIDSSTCGWEAVKADILNTRWESLVRESGIPKQSIVEAADLIAKSPNGIFMWAMGLTHHTHGVDNILALANVALSRGWLGKPGSGLLPLRGHSNVQGLGTVGVAPELKESFAQKLETRYPIQTPKEKGMDTYACMKAAEADEIDAAFILGGNLYGSNPDSDWAAKALQNILLNVYVSTKLNTGHFYGRGKTTLILPPLVRDEEAQATTQESMFNYIRLSSGGKPLVPHGEMRSEVDIIASLAKRILPDKGFDWASLHSHQKLREAISQVIPGLEGLSQIGATKHEFQIPKRTFHTPEFPTPTGKAHFHVTPLPVYTVQQYPFRLMTLRSEGQFNSVVYEEEDLYRGNSRRDIVMISQTDASALGVQEEDWVKVVSEVGECKVRISITDIALGSIAMYYPEANVLVPGHLDPDSRTPAFKAVPASIKPI